ncbi:hypothetical protein BOX15_Mlig005683g1 [Macrostomum lignano]|uniref:Uncharacterized protein n=1 Tax=Macrostomum lignano TaxID=282301 RepID=A0A267F983_9PLAT|nr:hypothetical protein BOX15_Mlig005683g1 [Macrostomum lignano]
MSRNEQCICKLCNCGRHKCKLHPNRPASNRTGRPCGYTEYAQKYAPHPPQPMQTSCKPANKPIRNGNDPMTDETTNRVDFVPHPLERPRLHQHEPYRPASGTIDATTVYQREYTEKRGERAAAVKREPRRANAGEFQGEPTYARDYRKWELPERFSGQGRPSQWEPSRESFGGVPTYQTDFVAHSDARPPASCKPAEAAKTSQSPLEDVTDYRQSYVPHQLERRRAKEVQDRQKPAVPFEGVTTFARDYTPKAGGSRTLVKPSAQAYASNAPFEEDTTHKLDYKAWELSRPFVHKNEPYAPPEGAIEGTTSYVRDYPAHPAREKVGYLKREPRGRPSGPFEGSTVYKENYRQWELSGRVQAGPNRQYQPNQAPFEGQSTTAAHFVPHQLEAKRNFKPASDAAKNDEPFDGTTLYRTEFVPKQPEPCPAMQLLAGVGESTAGYKFQGHDEKGHQIYAPRGASAAGADATTTVKDLKSGQLVSVK